MKKFLFIKLIAMAKWTFHVLLIQAFSISMLMANNSNGQSGQTVESIKHKQLSQVMITIEAHQTTLQEAFRELSQQTGFRFTYSLSSIPGNKNVQLTAQNLSLEDVLLSLSKQANLAFKRVNERIVVSRKKGKKQDVITETIFKDEKIISGKISNAENGEPLIGASVKISETNLGSITDVEGNFTLSVPEDANTLVVSYIGYEQKEVEIGNQVNFNIELHPDISSLNEVIVYGYGTGTKEKFNGAVSKIESKEINNYSTANFEQSLVGNVAGVQIMQNTKNPGESSTIQIRGISTLTAGTDPLLVVDGVPLTEGSTLSSINTRDIESINVLKDAASAAIYGSRASNGVILITTKKGEKGKLNVTYDGYFGFNQKIDNFQLVDAYDAAIFHYDARNNGYVTKDPDARSAADDNETRIANGAGKRELIPTYLQGYLNGTPGLTNTDWEDAVYRTAQQQSHYLNFSGGSEKTNYNVSLGYLNQENIVIYSGFERYSANISLNTQVNDVFAFGINLNSALSNTDVTDDRAWADLPPDPGFAFTLMDPYYPVYEDDGSIALAIQLNDHNQNWDGPIAENVVAHAAFTKNQQLRFRTFGNAYLELSPFDGLKFKSSFGGDYRNRFRDYFSPSFLGAYRTPVENNPASAFQIDIRSENFINENLLTYFKNFGGKHNLNLLLGQSFQQETYYSTNVEGLNFVDNNIRNISGANSFTVDNNRSKWTLSSLFSRAEYDFSGKYFLSAAVRRDGSSRFGSSSRYAVFTSFSGGWVISEEVFYPENNLMNFAKLRVSWGQSGNNQIGDFSSQSLLTTDNYTINGQLLGGTATETAPNDRLTWETNTSINYGIDLGFFDNQILLTAEYYNSITSDLLLQVPVPQQTGFSSSLQNIGELENYGFELEVNGRGFNFGAVDIGFNANIATNNNKVLALGRGQDQIIASANGVNFLTKIGEPIAQLYAYDIVGVFKSQEELDFANNEGVKPLAGTMVGDFIVRDADGNGVINPDDRVTHGDYNPELTFGFGLNLAFKGFDLAAQFDGISGRKLYDRIIRNAEAGEGFVIPSQYYFDNYYHPERNPDGFLASPNFGNFSSARRATRASNLTILNADFFRLRSLQIGYTLPENMTSSIGVSNLRVYLTGNNLLYSTDYRGLTSEAIRSNILTRGINYTGTPLSRFYALGLTVNF